MHNLDDDKFVLVLFRVIYEGGRVATLSQTQKINNKYVDRLLTFYLACLEVKGEEYKTFPVERYVI